MDEIHEQDETTTDETPEPGESQEAPKGEQDKPDGDKKPQFLIDGKPLERWNDLYGRYSRYAKYGKPEELEQKIQRLEQYEKALAQHRQGAKPTSEEELRQQLLQLLPELRSMEGLTQSQRAMQQRIAALNVERAQGRLSTLLKDHAIEVSPEEREDLEELLTTRMDDEQKQRLVSGDLAVVDEVFTTQLGRKGLLGYLKAKSAASKPPQKAPVRHGPTAVTPPKDQPKKKLKSLDEAGDVAYERFVQKMKGD